MSEPCEDWPVGFPGEENITDVLTELCVQEPWGTWPLEVQPHIPEKGIRALQNRGGDVPCAYM